MESFHSALLAALVSLFAALTSATALTYNFAPHERACFYAQAAEKDLKVAFYFAVQSGGSFDIDFEIKGPTGKIIIDGEKERQGDFVFTATDAGEYTFCFNNEMSTVTDKVVDFEISVEKEHKLTLPTRDKEAPAEQMSQVEESLHKVQGQINTINRMQKYFRTRENRNFSTVRSTESRIWRFSLIENFVMVAMAGLQVFIVRFFFTGSRKGYV